MSSKAPFPTVSFLDIPIHKATMNEVLDWMETSIRERKPKFLCTLNAALLVWSRKDPFLKQAYQSADLATADSTVVHYALKLLGKNVPEPLEACQIMFAFLKKNFARGYRFYFLGAKGEVLQEAIAALQRQYPEIQIAGFSDGYFKPEEEAEVAQKIRAAKPDCLFVGMSSPLKERFLKKYLDLMQVPVCLGVGGGIDILAGKYRLAPAILRKLGLAWFYRLLLEPRRMWKRYLITNSEFLWLFAKTWVKERTS